MKNNIMLSYSFQPKFSKECIIYMTNSVLQAYQEWNLKQFLVIHSYTNTRTKTENIKNYFEGNRMIIVLTYI